MIGPSALELKRFSGISQLSVAWPIFTRPKLRMVRPMRDLNDIEEEYDDETVEILKDIKHSSMDSDETKVSDGTDLDDSGKREQLPNMDAPD